MSFDRTLLKNKYFQNAYNGYEDLPILLGHLEDLQPKIKDIIEKKGKSAFSSRIFSPERYDEPYRYEDNKAWMAGGIMQRRGFELVSDITHYIKQLERKIAKLKALDKQITDIQTYLKTTKDKELENLRIGQTVTEILWLKDNGYTFKPNPTQPKQLIAVPPAKIEIDKVVLSDEYRFLPTKIKDILELFERKHAELLKIVQQAKAANLKQASDQSLFSQSKKEIQGSEKIATRKEMQPEKETQSGKEVLSKK